MKNSIVLFFATVVLQVCVSAQNVGIGTGTPNASAQLDVTSISKGILIPRMTTSRRTSIASPAKGLLVYDSTANSFWFHTGTVWTEINTGGGSTVWDVNGNNIYNTNAGAVGIGTGTPASSAILEIKSSNKGLLPPRTSTVTRNTITGVKGLIVYDTTTNSFWFHTGSAWNEVSTSVNMWSTNGNSGTNPAANFIGTTDNNDIIFKRNNIIAGSIGITNTAYGVDALNPAGTGLGNTANGASALNSNTTGAANTANGYLALNFNTTGNTNTANGNRALYNNIDGDNNTANGYSALFSNTTGIGNTANGYQALYYNTASSNTANGYRALFNNTAGFNNIANGYEALYSNNTGDSNTANGYKALYLNTSGSSNTSNGNQSLYSNTTGNFNTSSGVGALYSNSTGSCNMANGYQALYSNTTGDSNTATGHKALYSNITGNYNIANGVEALYFNSAGNHNTANGYRSLYANTTGNYNTATGYQTLFDNTTGHYNTAIGHRALPNNTTGDYNTATGYGALLSNDAGNYNTAVGFEALYLLSGGNYNTGIGYHANVQGLSTNSNATAIGYGASVNGSNKIILGNTTVAEIGGYTAWSNLSDSRFKSNIRADVPGLPFIMKLQPVTYKLDLHKLNNHLGVKNKTGEELVLSEEAIAAKEKIVYSGFEAQEVEKAAAAISYNFSGIIKPKNEKDHYSMVYSDFVPSLVKAIQELADRNTKLEAYAGGQQTLINDLKKENAAIKEQLQKIMQSLQLKQP